MLCSAGTGETSDDQPWTRQIRPLLDQATDVVHGFRPMDYRDEGMRAVTTFNRLAQLSDQLAKIPGPKTILWITTGVPNSIVYEYGGCRDITRSQASGSYVAGKCGLECRPNPSEHKCMDYSPFLRHLSASLNESDAILSSVEVTYEGAIPPTDSGTPADTIRQLANLTGGRVYLDSQLQQAFRESLHAARGRYELTYTAVRRDGNDHKLRVVCTRAGVRIQVQQGYFATVP